MLNRMVKDAVPSNGYDSQMTETMAERIKALREARGMSQTELGRYCGVTKSAVSQWEDGSTENIKLKTFLLLVKALGTDFEYLVYGPTRAPDPLERPRSARTANI